MALRRTGHSFVRFRRIDERFGEAHLVLARKTHDLRILDGASGVLASRGDEVTGQGHATQTGSPLHLVVNLRGNARFQTRGSEVFPGLWHVMSNLGEKYGKMPYHSRTGVLRLNGIAGINPRTANANACIPCGLFHIAAMSATTAPAALRLLAFDDEDLAVLSAHVQDMTVRPGDFAWLPGDKTFAFAGERFDWVGADGGLCQRVECGLHFERVLRVRKQAFDGQTTLNLLSILFEPGDAPSGAVTLAFSGGATIRLDVECLEAQLRDLGPRRPCGCKPDHPGDAKSARAAVA